MLRAGLDRLVEAAEAEWPALPLPRETFIEHVLARWPEDQDLSRCRAGDLYLACACAQGLPAALRAFDEQRLSQVGRYLAAIDRNADFVAEITQQARERLFVGAAPRILEYSGRGSLAGWLRVIAVHTALNHKQSRGQAAWDELDDDRDAGSDGAGGAGGADPELAYLRRTYQAEFKQALDAAIVGLSLELRNILKLHFVDRLTLDELAAALHLHRATIARRVAAARAAILDAVRQRLGDRLRLGAEELQSVLRLVRSQLDVSITRLLRGEAGRAG